jgi:hypothetical protein
MATNQNTIPDSGNYLKLYYATVRQLNTDVELFNLLSETSPDGNERELFRAKALEAARQVDLLTSEHKLYLADPLSIRRPTDEELATAVALTQELAVLAAKHAQAQAVLNIVTNAADDIKKISDAGAAAT